MKSGSRQQLGSKIQCFHDKCKVEFQDPTLRKGEPQCHCESGVGGGKPQCYLKSEREASCSGGGSTSRKSQFSGLISALGFQVFQNKTCWLWGKQLIHSVFQNLNRNRMGWTFNCHIFVTCWAAGDIVDISCSILPVMMTRMMQVRLDMKK